MNGIRFVTMFLLFAPVEYLSLYLLSKTTWGVEIILISWVSAVVFGSVFYWAAKNKRRYSVKEMAEKILEFTPESAKGTKHISGVEVVVVKPIDDNGFAWASETIPLLKDKPIRIIILPSAKLGAFFDGIDGIFLVPSTNDYETFRELMDELLINALINPAKILVVQISSMFLSLLIGYLLLKKGVVTNLILLAALTGVISAWVLMTFYPIITPIKR
ncbi:hypothetical protein A3L09_10725 (plasmid) [Thermococcus profundus]|uniref:Uncharacterized protein n=1 Tax=Thermococcus profundus TaxID=49899 RepID=A0A2Z2MJ12_THEPR|nr:hypothetical protein [Thermococcus profundus]ASJ03824.1 hypothetical protein A3L09_10725 [Thermococcus profundus]